MADSAHGVDGGNDGRRRWCHPWATTMRVAVDGVTTTMVTRSSLKANSKREREWVKFGYPWVRESGRDSGREREK